MKNESVTVMVLFFGGIVLTPLLVILLLPSWPLGLIRAPVIEHRKENISNMAEVANALHIYSKEHQEHLPESLNDLYPAYLKMAQHKLIAVSNNTEIISSESKKQVQTLLKNIIYLGPNITNGDVLAYNVSYLKGDKVCVIRSNFRFALTNIIPAGSNNKKQVQ